MALGGLPPWLSVTPADFLRATQAGVQAGHAIADSAQRAFEDQQRMQMEQERQKAVLAQQAIENAAQRLAAERLEQYRRSEVANQQQRLGIEQQRLRGLDIQQQRADDLARHQLAMEQQKLQADKTRDYGEPVVKDLGEGYQAIYRPGSPGLHLKMPRNSGGLTANVAGNLLKNLPEFERNMKMAGTNSLTAKYGPQLLSTALGGVPVSTSTNISPFKIISVKRRGESPSSGSDPVDTTIDEDTEE